MKITERELEDFIFDMLNKNKNNELADIGLDSFRIQPGQENIQETYYRQVSLGDYGRCDIFGYNLERDEEDHSKFYFSYKLVELKEGEINKDIIFQCLRYLNSIKKSIVSHNTSGVYGEIIIIGPSISKEVYDLIKITLGESVYIYTYTLSLTGGISFNTVLDCSFTDNEGGFGVCSGFECDGSCHKHINTGEWISNKIKQDKQLKGVLQTKCIFLEELNKYKDEE